MDDAQPICQIDISRVLQDDIGDHFQPFPGDHIIRTLVDPRKKKTTELYTAVLKTCLEYFFSLPRIDRIFTEYEEENELYNTMIVKAGFQFQQQVYQSYKVSNLYCCTRENYPV
jgi:RimJ/RimL family protein N-acetyltransferase